METYHYDHQSIFSDTSSSVVSFIAATCVISTRLTTTSPCPERKKIVITVFYKQNDLQFLFVEKAAALKQRM